MKIHNICLAYMCLISSSLFGAARMDISGSGSASSTGLYSLSTEQSTLSGRTTSGSDASANTDSFSAYAPEKIARRSRSTSSAESSLQDSSSLPDSYYNAIATGDRRMLVRVMLENPEGINTPFEVTPWGDGMLDQEIEMPPLMAAIHYARNYEAAMLLDPKNDARISAKITISANPDYTTADGVSLLELAHYHRNLSAFNLLLECNAETEIAASTGESLLKALLNQARKEGKQSATHYSYCPTSTFVSALKAARRKRAAALLSEENISRMLAKRSKRKCDLV